MEDRESWLTATLIELTDTLVSDFDLADLLMTLVDRCAELLDATEVGIVLLDQHDTFHAMASSTERMRILELFEIQSSEGPCLDCVRAGAPVGPVALDDAARLRWPGFAPSAIEAGYRAVVALPMRLRGTVLGAVNVFANDARTMSSRDLRVAQALADAATIGIVHEGSLRRSVELSSQLQAALASRVAIEQAKGMLAESHGVDLDTAFAMLRDHARRNNLRLAELARALGNRELWILGTRAVSSSRFPRIQT